MKDGDGMLRSAWLAYEQINAGETGFRRPASNIDVADALARLELEARLYRERLALERKEE